jgi:hypothetical protein
MSFMSSEYVERIIQQSVNPSPEGVVTYPPDPLPFVKGRGRKIREGLSPPL